MRTQRFGRRLPNISGGVSPCLAFRGAVRCGVGLPCMERTGAVMQIVLDRAGPEQRGWYANPVER